MGLELMTSYYLSTTTIELPLLDLLRNHKLGKVSCFYYIFTQFWNL